MLTEYAKREEIPEIAAFIDSARRAAYRHILAPEYLASMRVEERIKGLLERFDSSHLQFLRMRDGNGIAGVAVFGKSITESYPDDGEVSALYLRLDCTGKGYGHALLGNAETALVEMGYTAFVIDVFTENERAIKFYKAHGYKQIDENRIEFGGKEYPYTVFRKIKERE
ncbi:MAG: GNAT family N-acetyltransferase [Clostridiales Family XIII bacterium]|jgi:ribosomal protein S18 acetylase RimI-like enzyme|nr:GNAT family N-acetyltransferase [Clostridiales Family XIII bacterium]